MKLGKQNRVDIRCTPYSCNFVNYIITILLVLVVYYTPIMIITMPIVVINGLPCLHTDHSYNEIQERLHLR